MPDLATPTISIILPMRNESAAIEACLRSVLASRLPDDQSFELLLLDGQSTDDSVAKARCLADQDPRIRILDNPDRIQAAAFNRGLAVARGRYVLRMDAHTEYADDYVAESVRLLEETGADNVGCIARASGKTPVARAIAAAVSTRFAAGDAGYRVATTAKFTDTVFLGCWRIETLRALGGMRADWAVNEDYEMNVRLRARGGRVYLAPSLQSTYYVRASIPKLARQYFRYGFWKVRTLREHPGSIRWRQLVAPAFVLSLLVTPLAVHWLGWFGAIQIALYLVANLIASVMTARRTGWGSLPFLPIIFATVHLCWGSGFWCGLFYWPVLHRDRR